MQLVGVARSVPPQRLSWVHPLLQLVLALVREQAAWPSPGHESQIVRPSAGKPSKLAARRQACLALHHDHQEACLRDIVGSKVRVVGKHLPYDAQ